MPAPFHGLPPKPQGQAQPQAGPSRPPTSQPYRAQPAFQPPVQQPYVYQQNSATGYYPYGYQYQAATTGGYQPYAAYYQPSPQLQTHQPGYAYPYQQPTATPEGYSYSATYTPGGEPQNKRARVSGPSTSVPASTISVKPWRNCSHPGCKYVGSGEDVEIHEGDRHLIFPNGRPVERSEEEEKWASHKGPPPPIEGTGIVLGTEEDIAKWIAERKAKWPSAKRMAEREEERQAAIARGENPDAGRGRGRGGGRGGGGKRNNPAAAAEDWGRPEREDHAGQSSRGVSRGRGDRGRGRGRGRGRDSGYGSRAQPSVETPIEPQAAAPAVVNIANAQMAPEKAGLALAEYPSDGEDASSKSGSDSSSDTSSSSEDEAEAPPAPPVAVVNKPNRTICRFFAKTGRCKLGQKCRFSHSIDGKLQEHAKQTRAPPGPKQLPPKRANPFDRPSMLGALLAQPIQNTLSQLTQTIRFLVANDMLDGVELNPGEAEEQAREAAKISIMDQQDGLGDGSVEAAALIADVGNVGMEEGTLESQ